MTEKEIEECFNQVFNGMKNPMYYIPVKYFEYKNYLIEVARTPYHITHPSSLILSIGSQLFIDKDHAWVTIIKKNPLEKTNLSFRTYLKAIKKDDGYYVDYEYFAPYVENELSQIEELNYD